MLTARRVFVVGHSRAGKSTLAGILAEALECGVVSAGGWARRDHPNLPVGELTEAALRSLREDPDRTLRWVGERPVGVSHQVIEGVRNPRDLAILCDPTRDTVFLLKSEFEFEHATLWEKFGLDAIREYLEFAKVTWAIDFHLVWRRDDLYTPGIEHLIKIARGR